MLTLVTAPVGSTLPVMGGSFPFRTTLDTVLKSTAAKYNWQTSTGEIIKLKGSFIYNVDGSVDFVNSFVEEIRAFDTGSTTFDLSIVQEIAFTGTDLENLITGYSNLFWATALAGEQLFELHGDAPSIDLFDLIESFSLDGFYNSAYESDNDTAVITGSGTFSGDINRGFNDAADDDIEIDRAAATSEIFVAGDYLSAYIQTVVLHDITGGDDIITDISSHGGSTYLIGDFGDVDQLIAATGGNDTITGADIDSFLVGDFWVTTSPVSTEHRGGDDLITGGNVGSTLVGDIYDADGASDISVSTSHIYVGGNDSLIGGDGADEIYGEYVLNDISSFSGGDDTIEGGKGADTIFGQTGDDFIQGQNGNDSIEGGKGADTISGGSKADILLGGNGEDSLLGGKGLDTLLGGDGSDTLHGGDGQDNVEGGKGADLIFGEAGDDSALGGGGGDTLEGGNGADTLLGGDDADLLDGGKGDDSVEGEQGADTLIGQGGDDVLSGGKGDDDLSGGDANDTLTGGKGDDTQTGGNGADVFIFEDGHGDDVITDFDALDDDEDIDLSRVTAITDFTDLAANHMTQTGTDVLINDGAGLTITLSNVTLSDLTSGDFLF